MLKLLTDYSKTQRLSPEPGFAAKTIRWAIVCDTNGRFLDVLELGDTSRKRNPGQTFPKCPHLTQPELVAGGTTRSHFLVESLDVVALYGPKANNPKTQDKHRYFLNLLQQAATAVPELAAAARCLKDPATLNEITASLEKKKAKPTDKATIALHGRNPPCFVESTDWHQWWRDFRANLRATRQRKPARTSPKTQAQMRCFITGELVEPCPTHPKIRGLAGLGGLATGDALVCFDKPAFQSYGLAQSANAAISEQAAIEYATALNNLIRERGTRLAGNMVVHWFKTHVPPQDDPLAFLIEAETPEDRELAALQRARQLLHAIRTGKRPDLRNNYFYALTLSGAAGRVMVRDWMEGQFETLVANVNKWFDDLAIVRRDGNAPAPPPKFMAVLGSTVRDLNELPPPFVAKMWRVAVRAEPIPTQALAQALHRIKTAIIAGDTPNIAGIGILKAYHIRKGDKHMGVLLNENHPEPAYHCGRLMAVLARLQHTALGDIGAGVVQRYYAAASATPALRFGQLIRLSQFHLDKLDPGLRHWYENKLASIWAKIKDRLPATLTLEEQSLFALGYYHQIAADRSSQTETNNEKENSND